MSHRGVSDSPAEVRITPETRSQWRAMCRDCAWSFRPAKALTADLTTMSKARGHVGGRPNHRVRISYLGEFEYRSPGGAG